MAKSKTLISSWKFIFQYMLKYKGEIVLLSVLGIISAVANGVVPFITGRFFDAILEQERIFQIAQFELPVWLWLLILFGAVQVTANIVDWVNDVRSRKIGTAVYTGYPSEAVERMLRLPVSVHKDKKSGDMWSKIMQGRNALGQIIEQVILNLAPRILSVAIGLSIAFTIQPLLAWIIVGGTLVYIASLFKIVPPIVKLQKIGHRAWGRAFGAAYDAISNVQAVKQSTAEKFESKRVEDRFVKKVRKYWYRVEEIWGGIAFYQRLIVTLTQVSIFFISVGLVRSGSITIGDLLALNGYAAMVFGPFVQLGYNWQAIQNGIVAIDEAERLLSTPAEKYEPKNAVKLDKVEGEIEFKDVNFRYKKGEAELLDGINLKINKGEIIALVGESGVGKSTIVDLISGYYFPDKGSVLIDGHDVEKVSLNDLRNNIAVVPQEVVLFNDTIKANIKYGAPKSKDEDIKRAAKEAHADVFIKKFPKKYNQLVGERGIKLSVGQKQRVAIARAILRDPKILILDEPTSALDVQTEKYIEESLQKLMKGRTTIVIAHRLSTVRNADKIFVFDKGKVVEQGKHKDLIKIKNGVYRKLYELHIGLE